MSCSESKDTARILQRKKFRFVLVTSQTGFEDSIKLNNCKKNSSAAKRSLPSEAVNVCSLLRKKHRKYIVNKISKVKHYNYTN